MTNQKNIWQPLLQNIPDCWIWLLSGWWCYHGQDTEIPQCPSHHWHFGAPSSWFPQSLHGISGGACWMQEGYLSHPRTAWVDWRYASERKGKKLDFNTTVKM